MKINVFTYDFLFQLEFLHFLGLYFKLDFVVLVVIMEDESTAGRKFWKGGEKVRTVLYS